MPVARLEEAIAAEALPAEAEMLGAEVARLVQLGGQPRAGERVRMPNRSTGCARKAASPAR